MDQIHQGHARARHRVKPQKTLALLPFAGILEHRADGATTPPGSRLARAECLPRTSNNQRGL